MQAISLLGPGLTLGQDLTAEGGFEGVALTEEVRDLYDQFLAAVREKVEA